MFLVCFSSGVYLYFSILMYVKRHEQFEIGCGAILNKIYYYNYYYYYKCLSCVYCSIINLLWSLKSKMSTTFRPGIYGPCSRTGVTCVATRDTST